MQGLIIWKVFINLDNRDDQQTCALMGDNDYSINQKIIIIQLFRRRKKSNIQTSVSANIIISEVGWKWKWSNGVSKVKGAYSDVKCLKNQWKGSDSKDSVFTKLQFLANLTKNKSGRLPIRQLWSQLISQRLMLIWGVIDTSFVQIFQKATFNMNSQY